METWVEVPSQPGIWVRCGQLQSPDSGVELPRLNASTQYIEVTGVNVPGQALILGILNTSGRGGEPIHVGSAHLVVSAPGVE